MTTEEYRTQIGLWCMLAAPLFASNDLTRMSKETLEILTSREVIAVDHGKAGIQGHRAWHEGPLELWVKALADGSKAAGMFNREKRPMTMTLRFKDVGVTGAAKLRNPWVYRDIGKLSGSYTAHLPGHGAAMLKIEK